jgi:hypothetical protein
MADRVSVVKLGLVFFAIAVLFMLGATISVVHDHSERIVKLEQACHGQCVRDMDAACKDRCAKKHHCPEVDY